MNPFIKEDKTETKSSVGKKKESTSSMRIIVNVFYEPVDELKRILVSNKDVYLPILGGASRPDVFVSDWVREHCQMDNTGDNISVHNKVVNEMTSIYWAWKHYLEIGDPDYIGFNHYRRFFDLDDLKDRDEYDIVCAERLVFPQTVYGAYKIYHKAEDMNLAANIVKTANPEFWVDFHNAISGNTLFSCNMFLMKRELFFEYCETVFPLVSRIAANVNLEGRDNYQKRAVCFLAERMTSAWIEGQALNHGRRIKQVPIVYHKEFKDNNLNEREPMADPKVALVCIAKNEDNYLDEWVDYHALLGVDNVFVYQNDWRFKPKREHGNLTLIEFDGECRQLAAYNDFVFGRSGPYDFGIFIDADEFVCMLDGKESLKGFLSRVADCRDAVPAVALNWRLFGDSGCERVVDGDYSLLKRFTMCQRGLNPHVKTIVNFNAMRMMEPSVARRLFSFVNPHCLRMSLEWPYVLDSTLAKAVHGPFNENADVGKAVACVNHYFSKTWQEFVENKKPKGKADFLYSDPKQELDMSLFGPHNMNEVECTIARDFYVSHGGL